MSRASRCLLVGVAALAGVAGCDKGRASDKTGTGAGTGTVAAPVPAGNVGIYIGDQRVAMVDAARLATWPRLDELVPPQAQRLGTWESVAIAGAAPQEIKAPADTHPNLVPALYPGPDGAAAFGMFDLVDLVKHEAPKVSASGVREIRIKLLADSDRGMNEDSHAKMVDPTTLVVTIEGGTVPQLTGAEIIALPRETPPNGDTSNQGWKLTTLLERAGIKQPKALVLTDANGTTLNLTAAELDPATSVPFIKLNKQGVLRFRVYTKAGDGWGIGGNLRGLTSIKVTKK